MWSIALSLSGNLCSPKCSSICFSYLTVNLTCRVTSNGLVSNLELDMGRKLSTFAECPCYTAGIADHKHVAISPVLAELICGDFLSG